MISDNHHLFYSFRFDSRFGEIRTCVFDWITVFLKPKRVQRSLFYNFLIFWMNIYIVANVWNIEEACKEAYPMSVFSWYKFSVNQQSLLGSYLNSWWFPIITIYFIASDLTLGLVRSNLCFNCLACSQSIMRITNIII